LFDGRDRCGRAIGNDAFGGGFIVIAFARRCEAAKVEFSRIERRFDKVSNLTG
jgi:hypothetical protein